MSSASLVSPPDGGSTSLPFGYQVSGVPPGSVFELVDLTTGQYLGAIQTDAAGNAVIVVTDPTQPGPRSFHREAGGSALGVTIGSAAGAFPTGLLASVAAAQAAIQAGASSAAVLQAAAVVVAAIRGGASPTGALSSAVDLAATIYAPGVAPTAYPTGALASIGDLAASLAAGALTTGVLPCSAPAIAAVVAAIQPTGVVASAGGLTATIYAPGASSATLSQETSYVTAVQTSPNSAMSVSVSTAGTNRLLVVKLECVTNGTAVAAFGTVSGGGLTWTKKTSNNTGDSDANYEGCVEIWTAPASAQLTGAAISTTSPNVGASLGSARMVVEVYSKSDGTMPAVGAAMATQVGAYSSQAAIAASFTPQAAGSIVTGIAFDWSGGTAARTLVSGQSLVSADSPNVMSDPLGYVWVQQLTAATANTTAFTFGTTAPSGCGKIAAIEVKL